MTTADAATRVSAKGVPVYERLVLKLSGESLSGPEQSGIHAATIQGIAHEVKEVQERGVQVAIMVGGGNIFRGTRQKELAIDRATGDYMGMLATVINGLALMDALEKAGCFTRLMSAIEMHQVAEPFIRRRATRHLEKDRVVIFAAGTGNPYFSTDTAAALRAMEIKAQVILKATRVDGVYDADPEKVKGAKRFERITYLDVLQKGLLVMDSTAISLCMDNQMPIVVFNMTVPGNLKRVVLGEQVGSTVTAAGDSRGGGEFLDEYECHEQGRAGAGQDADGESSGGFPQGIGQRAHGAREHGAARSCACGLSRHADADQSAGHVECAGCFDDRDFAVGSGSGGAD